MASASISACPSASTSTIDDNACYQYQVFINHRGPDVKKTFATHLYHRLRAHQLRVFLDKEEMKKGEKITCQIEGAIRTASVQIAIFSPTYAHSRWCLDELVLMLESMREKGSIILPVFFRVKPSELRGTDREEGVYAKGLCSLQPRYDSNTIGNWKKALHEVAEISGFELEEGPYNGDEEKLLADVVERVLERVPKPPLFVSKYPTGLDNKVEDFKRSVLSRQHESGEARVVGIWGLGGVGKTTLAKEFFNGARTNYRRSSFLSDVRENHSSRSLIFLQRILLKDLTQLDVEIKDTHEGPSLLKRHLSPSQALIVVDDVDHIEQLNGLVSPAKDVLGSNSLILVTSRDKGVLINWGIDELFIYELKGLDPEQSTELFCSHAFHQPRPDAGFEHVVKDFVVACNGLPLSLKVIGALLYGRNLEYWEAQFRKISKILPEDIHKTLKISYDSLDEEQKQIFLDTACFFVGEEKDRAIKIWDESGWEGSLGLQNLQEKCLLEVEVRQVWDSWADQYDLVECIRMHDHVRDLGRSLAKREAWRRIWQVQEIQISGERDHIVSNSGERDHLVSGFSEVPYVERVFSVVQPTQVIMLGWYNCPYSSLPSQFSTEKLRILYIQGYKLETPWHLESQAPLELRELHISASRLLKIPESIGQLKHLEKIVIRSHGMAKGMAFETLPDEFCELTSLKHLELDCCKYLRSLPDSFGNLTSLQYVKFHFCNRLERLPDSFGSLTKLQHVDLSGCWKLQMQPNSFGNLIHLKYLDLTGCEQLTLSSKTLGKITTLEVFRLSGKNIKVMPPQLTYQRLLQELHLGFDFKELPSDIGNLSNLKILYLKSSSLETLPPSFSDLRSLEELYFVSCPLEELYLVSCPLKKLSIGRIKNLEVLEIEAATGLKVVYPNLQHLHIYNCDCLVEVGALPTGLQHLHIQECHGLLEVGALPTGLQHLYIEYCLGLVEVGALSITLQRLEIKGCRGLEELTFMETLVSLEHLFVDACWGLKRIHGLGQLTKLQSAYFGCSPELEELAGVEHSRSLKNVEVYECPKLKRKFKHMRTFYFSK